MSSPQLENGYTRIANELLDAIIRWPFGSYEFRVLMFIIRKTYGWDKIKDKISLSQFVEETGIQKPHVCRALKILEKQKIIIRNGTRNNPIYGIQKNYEMWIKMTRNEYFDGTVITPGGNPLLPQGATVITPLGNSLLPQGAHTKETITKEKKDVVVKPPTSSSKSGLTTKTKSMKQYDETKFSDDGETVVDIESGEVTGAAAKPKREGKNKIAIRLQHKFAELCKKNISVTPVLDGKGYSMVLFALNSGKLTEKNILDLFDEWFSLGKDDEETIQITRALSSNQINSYKIRNNVK